MWPQLHRSRLVPGGRKAGRWLDKGWSPSGPLQPRLNDLQGWSLLHPGNFLSLVVNAAGLSICVLFMGHRSRSASLC